MDISIKVCLSSIEQRKVCYFIFNRKEVISILVKVLPAAIFSRWRRKLQGTWWHIDICDIEYKDLSFLKFSSLPYFFQAKSITALYYITFRPLLKNYLLLKNITFVNFVSIIVMKRVLHWLHCNLCINKMKIE